MTLQLPSGDFRAYLFDCDGTIADSMPLHFIAWDRALREAGCTSFTEDLFYAWGGWPVEAVVNELWRRDNRTLLTPTELDAFAHRKEGLYYELFPQLQPVPEVLELILADHGRVPFAVVSGSTRDSVTRTLTALGILDRFDILVCAGDYARGKPDPEPFLTAAQRLHIPPANCLVFEDADAGIRSAQAAGMAWVRIPSPPERSV
jgi:HAD superfamily hydrolase (TIGR01509 family)